ncbi:MAG: thiamine phosphate synthase [Paludibacteraceae bacterium]|nr:thiamine phosphate synthase [Paludibacteraceae bacterium]MBN2787117.1 thiamine phosphate synthase [Paludibacteraceae bacterium]
MRMLDLSLYLVTDRSLSLGRKLEWMVEEAVKGGVTVVQLREKDCTTREFIELACALKQKLCSYNVPLLINDRVDVALAADADGVHIGQSDMPYAMARKLLGSEKIIGLSVENLEQVYEANKLDVDYIGISPVFSTNTKTDTATPFGIEGIKQVMAVSKHPAVAIGGINSENATAIMQAGANGIAVVSAICSANDPYQAALQLKQKLK